MYLLSFCVLALSVLPAASGNECSGTVIQASDRIDCNVRPNDQATCEAAGCKWCANDDGRIAKCFLNKATSLEVLEAAAAGCSSTSNCKVRINCHPDIITYAVSQASCEMRGCLWLGPAAVQDQPRCVYYNKPVSTTATLPSGAFPKVEAFLNCTSCSTCNLKYKCLENEANPNLNNEKRCQREGCIWCNGECIFGQPSALRTLASQCTSCSNCPANAYIKAGSEEECNKRGATWCSSRESSPEDRRCVLLKEYSKDTCNSRNLAEKTCKSCSSCSTIFDCKSVAGENQTSCENKGCLWCPNSDSKPVCRYGSIGYQCISKDICDIQFPRFQKIQFELKTIQRPHLKRLMEVLCYSQLGVWAPDTADKCLAAFPLRNSPIKKDLYAKYNIV
nr:uncharacterized protein LOC100181131 [Ciona intestinalis]|eukprot:XP_018673430.2 uncharacterized protein LOC100181131 [Ciona intestinalis]